MSDNDRVVNLETISDPQVSAAYRDLSQEKPSLAMDQRILRLSRANTKKAGARWMRRSRTVAVAATVVLCVALVLDVQLHEPPGSVDDGFLDSSLEPLLPNKSDTDSDKAGSSAARQKQTRLQFTASEPTPQEQSEARDDRIAADGSIPTLGEAESQVEFDSAMRQAASRKEQQPNRIRVDVESDPQPARQPAAFVAEIADAEPRLDREQPACSSEDRASPKTWYECILGLDSMEDAEAELTLLEQQFPTFVGDPTGN